MSAQVILHSLASHCLRIDFGEYCDWPIKALIATISSNPAPNVLPRNAQHCDVSQAPAQLPPCNDRSHSQSSLHSTKVVVICLKWEITRAMSDCTLCLCTCVLLLLIMKRSFQHSLFFVSLCLFSPPSLALLALFLPFFRAFHITVLLFRIAYFLPRFSQLVFAQKQKEKEGNNKKKNTSFLGCYHCLYFALTLHWFIAASSHCFFLERS